MIQYTMLNKKYSRKNLDSLLKKNSSIKLLHPNDIKSLVSGKKIQLSPNTLYHCDLTTGTNDTCYVCDINGNFYESSSESEYSVIVMQTGNALLKTLADLLKNNEITNLESLNALFHTALAITDKWVNEKGEVMSKGKTFLSGSGKKYMVVRVFPDGSVMMKNQFGELIVIDKDELKNNYKEII